MPRLTSKYLLKLCAAGGAALLLGGCEPEVGSEAWCELMEEKPKGDWTMNAAADYAKHCVLKLDEAPG